MELSQSSFFHGKVSNATHAKPTLAKSARVTICVTGLGLVIAASLVSTRMFTTAVRSRMIGRGRVGGVGVCGITERIGRHPGVSRMMIGMRTMAGLGGIACPARK